jgi:alpha-N-arabinofuranosidase
MKHEAMIKVKWNVKVGNISPFLYGAGFEHLGGAVTLGLDAQMIKGGSFEEEDVNQDGVADAWNPEGWGGGTVRYSRDGKEPLHGQYAQRIELLSHSHGEMGIAQRGLGLVRHKQYIVSLFLRQKGMADKGQVKIYLRGKRKIYAEGAISGISSDWQQHTLPLMADTTTGNAEFLITMTGKGALWIDQVRLVPEDTFRGHGTRRDLMEKIMQLAPTCMRWPGGWFSEIYRWKEGIGEVDRRPWRKKYYSNARMKNNPSWESNRFGTDEYIQFCRDIGAAPLLTVNIGYEEGADLQDYLKEAGEWVEYCNGECTTAMGALRASHGSSEPYHVRFWEIGNEPWEMDPKDYARRFIRFAQIMREKDPGIKLIAAGGNGYDMRWNEKVIENAGPHMDYLDLHHYYCNEDYWETMAEPLKYGEFLDHLRNRIFSAFSGKAVKGSILEWNSNNNWKDANQLKEGLFAASFFHVLERRGDWMEHSIPWPLLRRIQPSGNHVSDHGLLWYDNRKVYLSSTALAFQLYRKNYAPEQLLCEVNCETFDSQSRKKVPYLDAVATRDREGRNLIVKVINKCLDREIKTNIELDGFISGQNIEKIIVLTLSAASIHSKNSLDHPHEVKITEAVREEINKNGTYAFPRHSISVIRFILG